MVRFQLRHALCFAAAFAVLALAANPAQADLTIGSEIFNEEFSGTALDSGVWEAEIGGGGSISVNGGSARFTTPTGSGNAYATSLNTLDFSSSPNQWGAEVAFNLFGAYSSWSPSRHYVLLNGLSTSTENGWTNQGFDLRTLREDSEHFSLAWNGWDNDGERNPTPVATGVLTGVAHTVQLLRKANDTVDIYLDGALVSNQDLIGGVNPAQLRLGDITGSVECDVSYDSIKIGTAVPEPASIIMVVWSAIGLLAYAWRRHK